MVPSHLLYIYDEGGGPASNEFVLYRGRRLWDTAVREGIGGPSFPFRQRQAPSLPPAFRSPPWMDTDQEVVVIFPPPSDDIFQPAKLISPVFFIPLLNKYIEIKKNRSIRTILGVWFVHQLQGQIVQFNVILPIVQSIHEHPPHPDLNR